MHRGSESSSVSVDNVYLYQSPSGSAQGSPPGSAGAEGGGGSSEGGSLEAIPLRPLRPGPLAQAESFESDSSRTSSDRNEATGTSFLSLCVKEDGEEEVRAPTPPPRRFRRPLLVRQSSSAHSCGDLPSGGEDGIAASLCLAQLPAMAVAGVVPAWRKRRRLGDAASSHIPTHRASYHGSRDTSLGWNSDSPLKSKSGDITNADVLGSAESLIGRVLLEQGLGKYCDPDFVRTTQRELAEAINLTQEEMDLAAHHILQLERRQSPPGSEEQLLLPSPPDPQTTEDTNL